jgi:hypothetical protein
VVASAGIFGNGGVAAAWVVSWIASIVLAFWLLSKSPKIPGMHPKAQRARIGMVVMAFVPCLFVDILWTLGFYAMYRFYTRGMHDQQGLQERFGQTSFNAPQPPQQFQPPQSSANPFTAGHPTPQPPQQQAQRPQPTGNPFADSPPMPPQALPPQPPRSTPPSNNPFLQE